MRRLVIAFLAVLLISVPVWAQTGSSTSQPKEDPQIEKSGTTELRSEIDRLKKTISDLEERLSIQEKKQQEQEPVKQKTDEELKDLNRRVVKTERDSALQRIRFSGDYRFEAHSIFGTIPAHYDGMQLQNLLVKSMFAMNVLGRPPMNINEINGAVAGNYGDYLYFTNNLTFDQLKQAMGKFPPQLQQQLFGMLMPATFVPEYGGDNKILYTNRFRLNLDSQVSENVSVTARLSMYKVFGDSTGVQVFNGQPNSLNIDGTTAGVPNSDQVRVERAYFTWNKIGGTPFFLSIGRRPSTEGPPMHYRQDEPRAGTPIGALISYQFDGVTFGYRLGENTILRFCYGLGYESGFGNGNLLKMPQDRLKDVHFVGGNFDVWASEKTLIQATVAKAFDVTDGFNGLIVLPNNPLTGDKVTAPVVMRFTPSANLGDINLAGVLFSRKMGRWDAFVSANYVGLRPNGLTTPFGGLGSDPFETPENHNGGMIYAGIRYSFANDDRTKIGFEYNRGSKYWFNFAQAEDDIIAPKTNARGSVFETYLTHRINNRFIFRADYIRYDYKYSGSGWHLGAPKDLDEVPILGFPTYKRAYMISFGLTARSKEALMKDLLKYLSAACFLILALFLNFPLAQESEYTHVDYFEHYEGTKTCLQCHEEEAKNFFHSQHYQWRGEAPQIVNARGKRFGKMNTINDFCTSPTGNWIGFVQNSRGDVISKGCSACHAGFGKLPSDALTPQALENMDCLICHANGYRRDLFKNDANEYEWKPILWKNREGLDSVAKRISLPTRTMCLRCHSASGGGPNYKRGDIEYKLADCDRDYDVHMAKSGKNMQCVACHAGEKHRVLGRGTDLSGSDMPGKMLGCDTRECHSSAPHAVQALNVHAKRINCTVCHIPSFAREDPTDMARDWSKSVYVEETDRYTADITLQKNVTPVYKWYNGTTRAQLPGEPVARLEDGSVGIMTPQGRRFDPKSRIYAFKLHKGRLPLLEGKNWIVPITVEHFFSNGKIDPAVKNAAKEMYGIEDAKYAWTDTSRYMGIFHGVQPASKALQCLDCHSAKGRMDWKALGYRGDPLDALFKTQKRK